MSFADLLNKPLPSIFAESEDIAVGDPETPEDEEMKDPIKSEGCGAEACGTEGGLDDEELELPDSDLNTVVGDEEDDDLDLDDLSDEELEALDGELEDELVDGADDGEEEEVDLTPEEEMEADDLMSVAATTTVVNSEMNAEERASFLESEEDLLAAVNEGLLTESDINEIAMNDGLVTEAKGYSNKMVVRLDKQARMKQLYSLAINVCAAAKHDADYMKYKKVMRQRKILKKRLQKKYHGEAMKRMKIYMRRLSTSKSKPLASLGKKIVGK